MLQCRSGKRTGDAAIKVATCMVEEGLVSVPRAISKLVEPRHLAQLLHPQFDNPEAFADKVIGKGLAASPGAAGAPSQAFAFMCLGSVRAQELHLVQPP